MRYVVVIVGLLVVVGGLAAIKFAQISSLIGMGEQMAQAGPMPEAVASTVAKAESWEETLSAVGNIAGVKGVTISTETAGIVTRINFESGDMAKQGQVLVELDTGVERAQLASAKARRDLAEVTVARSRQLVAEGVLARAQLDNDEAQLKSAITDYAALQAQIERRIVRAPFTGRLGIRAVNKGQYLNPGTTLTTLEAIGGVFVDFTLPQAELGRIAVGMPLRVRLEQSNDPPIEGVLSAISPTLDDTTRSLQLRGSIPNEQEKLRPGMFVDVELVMPKRAEVVAVPATAIIYASYGDSVFIVEDKKPDAPGMRKTPDGKTVRVARQQFVRLGPARGDFVAILEGVKAGQEVVTAGGFKLRNGSPIVIDNTIKPDAKLNPRPENR